MILQLVLLGLVSAANVGCLGNTLLVVPLASIMTTEDMVGLSFARSCTHKSPASMHLDSFVEERDFYMVGIRDENGQIEEPIFGPSYSKF